MSSFSLSARYSSSAVSGSIGSSDMVDSRVANHSLAIDWPVRRERILLSRWLSRTDRSQATQAGLKVICSAPELKPAEIVQHIKRPERDYRDQSRLLYFFWMRRESHKQTPNVELTKDL